MNDEMSLYYGRFADDSVKEMLIENKAFGTMVNQA